MGRWWSDNVGARPPAFLATMLVLGGGLTLVPSCGGKSVTTEEEEGGTGATTGAVGGTGGASGGRGGNDSSRAGGTVTGGVCANGVWEMGEQCDDGNLLRGDGCDAMCVGEVGWSCGVDGAEVTACAPVCGDGRVRAGEVCDDGEDAVEYGLGCGPDCRPAPFCGDGVVDPAHAEECDLGWEQNRAFYDGCTRNCRVAPHCGDGMLDSLFGEICDRGELNGEPGQACSRSCTPIVL